MNARRLASLLRLAEADAEGWNGRPSASATRAASTNRPITNRQDSGWRRGLQRAHDCLHRRGLVVESNRNRLIPPRVLELVAAVAGKHQAYAQLLCRFAEGANLVAGGGGTQENACHRWNSIGSAQQYHASVIIGTRTPRRDVRAGAVRPARAYARAAMVPNKSPRAMPDPLATMRIAS